MIYLSQAYHDRTQHRTATEWLGDSLVLVGIIAICAVGAAAAALPIWI
jgi:hypothetical protein